MIVYNVTVNIDNSAKKEWLQWMLNDHIPAVLATGLFLDGRISELLLDEENGGTTFSIQYTLHNMQQLETYQQQHAPRLQADHQNRYAGKFVAFRTVMEVHGHLKV